MFLKKFKQALKIFGKRAPEPVPERKDMAKILASEERAHRGKKHIKRGTPITKTAVVCLSCDLPLLFRRRDTVTYTCSDICRKLLRGGKRNMRLLTQWFNTRREEW